MAQRMPANPIRFSKSETVMFLIAFRNIGTASNPNGTQYSLNGGFFSPKVNFFLPGDTDFETALFKNMPLNEKGLKLQLRVETYNTFNHPILAAPDLNIADTAARGFGAITSSQGSRQFQLGLKFYF